ncbi:MAG: chromate efflux transporter [bacterium]
MSNRDSPTSPIPFSEALRVWWHIGVLSFGGPAGQIALMHKILVDEKKWLDEKRFLHALNYCMLLPGPEAQQLATYVGWLLHGVRGGLVAGTLFILPGAAAILLISVLYALYGQFPLFAGILVGLKAAVLAIVVQALIRLGQRALTTAFSRILALAAFMGLFVFQVPFPFIVLGAGLAGLIYSKRRIGIHRVPDATNFASNTPDTVSAHLTRSTRNAALIMLMLWVISVALIYFSMGKAHVFSEIGLFFSKMAMVTFGGAYAVLSYVAQQGVEHYQWLRPDEMLDGLGLAETTPGPLILVTQFVGFMAGFRETGIGHPIIAGITASILTTWVTFLPCFLWIFAGAPHVEKLRGNALLSGMLEAITAAVVGVIANLALWFALHALFLSHRTLELTFVELELPDIESFSAHLGLTSLVSLTLIFLFRLGHLKALVVSCLFGITMGLMV